MPIYLYRALNSGGQEVSGHIDANNPQSAQSKLRKQGLYVRELKEDTGKRDRELFPFLSKLIFSIPRKDIGLFARQLATLLGAGIMIDNALSDIIEQTNNKHLQKVIIEIKAKVLEGKSLSEAMGGHRDIFPPIYESMVKIGEATGNYETILGRLADVEDKNADLRGKTISSLIYPMIMFVLSIMVVFFLLTFVIPQITSIFKTFDAPLPLPTKMVIWLSNFMITTWPVQLLSVLGAIYGIYTYRKTPVGKWKLDQFLMKVPVFGKLLIKLEVSRFTRNLGILLHSNVPLLKALEIVTATCSNEVFRRELAVASKKVEEGSSLIESLRNSTFIPHMIKGMMSAGESTDRLGDMTMKAADIQENELDTTVRGLTSALQPVIIVFLGGIVFFILISVMLPIFKLSSLIQ
ncbi:MAG: type II secretion system F family protein [Spirochaetia bacterium]|nr:type II secretion system F family protein [Spirochaetia bacterium]